MLEDVSFCVWPGELNGILGGSGSGKSTILRLAIGLDKPDSGKILIDGTDITALDEQELSEIRRRMGMVFQGGALFNSLTVYETSPFAQSSLVGMKPA